MVAVVMNDDLKKTKYKCVFFIILYDDVVLCLFFK